MPCINLTGSRNGSRTGTLIFLLLLLAHSSVFARIQNFRYFLLGFPDDSCHFHPKQTTQTFFSLQETRRKEDQNCFKQGLHFALCKPVLMKLNLNLIHLNYVCPLAHGGFSAAIQRQNEKMCLGWGGTGGHTSADWNKLEESSFPSWRALSAQRRRLRIHKGLIFSNLYAMCVHKHVHLMAGGNTRSRTCTSNSQLL